MVTAERYIKGEIAAAIGQIADRHLPLTIASMYKGIVLTQPTQVLDILPDRVVVQAPEHRLCYTLKEKVHLYSHALPETISAKLLELDAVLGKVALSDLDFLGQSWVKRLSERVEPGEPLYVDMTWGKNQLRAGLENLSMTGMSLMAYMNNVKDFYIEHIDHRDTPVKLSVPLPGEDAQLTLKGRIVRCRRVKQLVMIGICFIPDAKQAKRLHRYIEDRKAEILDELESAHRQTYEQRQALELYF